MGGWVEKDKGREETMWIQVRPGPSTHPGSRNLILLSPSWVLDTANGQVHTSLWHIPGSAEKLRARLVSSQLLLSCPQAQAGPHGCGDIASGRLEFQVDFCEEGTAERGLRGKSWPSDMGKGVPIRADRKCEGPGAGMHLCSRAERGHLCMLIPPTRGLPQSPCPPTPVTVPAHTGSTSGPRPGTGCSPFRIHRPQLCGRDRDRGVRVGEGQGVGIASPRDHELQEARQVGRLAVVCEMGVLRPTGDMGRREGPERVRKSEGHPTSFWSTRCGWPA